MPEVSGTTRGKSEIFSVTKMGICETVSVSGWRNSRTRARGRSGLGAASVRHFENRQLLFRPCNLKERPRSRNPVIKVPLHNGRNDDGFIQRRGPSIRWRNSTMEIVGPSFDRMSQMRDAEIRGLDLVDAGEQVRRFREMFVQSP